MNKFIGLYVTYLVYLFSLLGILYAFLSPIIANAWFEKKEVVEVKVEEIHFNYALNEKVPEFVIDELISRYATGDKAYGMKRTIFCESHYWNVQSNVINKYGQREDSWGLAQINLYWNDSVTKSQALDIEFAIKWMSDHWDTTKWYGWDREKDICNSVYN